MQLFIGLGNPGDEYKLSHHNVGFLVVDEIAKILGTKFSKKTDLSEIAETNFNGEKILLAKPQTYMNNSGEAVKLLCKRHKMEMKNVVIIHDDIDILASKVRIRNHGSAGTHNGMKSVLENVSTNDFIRVRVGIGPFVGDLSDFVLKKMKKNSDVFQGIKKATEACLNLVKTKDYEKTVQKFSE